MKKILLIMVMLVTLCACGTEVISNGVFDELLLKKDTIIVGVSPDYPPYESLGNNGEIVGFDSDVLNEVVNHINEEYGSNIKIEWKILDFDMIIASLQSKQIDIGMSGFSYDPSRDVQFSTPYIETKQVVVTRKDTGIHTIQDLENKKIGVQLGTTGETAVNKLDVKVGKINAISDYSMAFNQLKAGNLDALVADEAVAFNYVDKLDLVMLDETLVDEKMCMILNNDQEELGKLLNEGIEHTIGTTTYTDIQEKWGLLGSVDSNTDKILTKENIKFMLEGAKLSMIIATCSLILGTLIGTLLATMKIGKNMLAKFFSNTYIQIIRGTPMLLQLIALSLGIPMIYHELTGGYVSINPVIVAIIAISINSGAYSAELIRATINSIDKGQVEAGKCLGLSQKQIMKKIILPQAFRRLIPPLTNEFITLIKDSSLASTIGVIELMMTAQILNTKYYSLFIPIMSAACFYLVVTFIVSVIANKLERRFS